MTTSATEAARRGDPPSAAEQAAPAVPAGHLHRALGARTLAEAFAWTAAACADRPALRTADGLRYSWAGYRDAARRCASGLARIGLRPGDTIALLLGNVPEFHIVDAAAMTLGVTTCSLYPTAARDELRYLIDDSGARVLVCDAAHREQADDALATCAKLRTLILVGDGQAPGAAAHTLAGLMDGCPGEGAAPPPAYRPRPEDVLTVVYTSGTTGPPKGVEITHATALATGRAFVDRVPLEAGSRLVSYLPMAHIAERCCSHYLPMALGADVACCPEPERLFTVLPRVRPQWLFSVPRIWEKLHHRLLTELDAAPEDFRRAALRALDLGESLLAREDAADVPEGDPVRAEYDELDRSTLAPLRALLGLDQVRFVHVGAAPARAETLVFLRALGLPVGEIWGMTELCAAACVTVPGRHRLGWIGPPLPGVHVDIAADGEVLVKGPITMRGYRGKPEATAAVVDEQGWVHTGDLGEVADDGSLRIIGRKKELIVNAYGKNMAPVRIEAEIAREEPLIEQVCVVGDGRPYNVALITAADATGTGDAGAGAADAAGSARIAAAVGRANRRLSRPERIKRFAVLAGPWTPAGGLITPTWKLRRQRIEQHYRTVIDALYADGGLTPDQD